MGIVKTSVFQLEAPDDVEPLNNWAGIARRNSAVMDAAMAQRVTPPGVPDLNAEITARTAADAALAARATALEATRTVWVKSGITAAWTFPSSFTVVPGLSVGGLVVPAGKRLEVDATFPWVAVVANSSVDLELRIDSTVIGSATWSTAAAAVYMPAHIMGRLDESGAARTVTLAVYGKANTASQLVLPSSGMVPQLRYRLV